MPFCGGAPANILREESRRVTRTLLLCFVVLPCFIQEGCEANVSTTTSRVSIKIAPITQVFVQGDSARPGNRGLKLTIKGNRSSAIAPLKTGFDPGIV